MQRTPRPALALRPHALALAVTSLIATLPAWAQTAPAAVSTDSPAPAATPSPAAAKAKGAADAKPAVVEITGTRASQQGSILRKRTASTVSDSIVAEDIDQFPDKNVGEALSRITGVQLTREFGEGSQIAIRGVEPDLNRIEVNGKSVLSTNGLGGRGAELRELPAELISSIDVIKGSTADMTEGGIGGTVRINTRKPLDFKERTVAFTLSGESASSRGGIQPRGSLLLADRFLDNKLGLMANLVYDKVYTRNDYARNTSWTFLRDWDFSADKTLSSLNPTAAAVTSKAGCASLTGTSKTDCEKQWYDYAPRISRYGIWERTGQATPYRDAANFANGNTRDPQGRLITCEGAVTRRVVRTEPSGRNTVLADKFDGKSLNSPNDIVCQSEGSVWFTDPPFQLTNDYEGRIAKQELPHAIYRIDGKSGQVTQVLNDVAGPNGLCFSPDEKTLYIVEGRATPNRLIWAYEVLPGGKLGPRRKHVEALNHGAIDGIKCDADGNLWCGWGSTGAPEGKPEELDGVMVFNPQGKAIGHIRLPERCANLCFGGADNNRLFMAASHSIYALYVNTRGGEKR